MTAFLISQPDPNFKPKASAGTSGRAVTRRGAGLNQLAHQTGTAARAALPQASFPKLAHERFLALPPTQVVAA